MARTLPSDFEHRAKTTYEQFVEEGIEKGISLKKRDFSLRLWETQEFPLEKIALLVGIAEQQVVDIVLAALVETGKTTEEAEAAIAAHREKYQENKER